MLRKVEPNEPLELVPLDPSCLKATAIGIPCNSSLWSTRMAWSREDMPKIGPYVMLHHLSVDLKAKGGKAEILKLQSREECHHCNRS